MNLKTFARLGRRSRRLVWGAALTGLMMAAGTSAIGDVHPDAKRMADDRRETLSLFAGPTAVLQGNQFQCGIVNDGDVCSNVFNSPTGGGGFWPTGSQNQYIFNTGLQVAGIMGGDGGPWAGDTVGAYFFDARGTQKSTVPLTSIFNSLNSDDIANWPAEAFIPEGSELFQPVLQGRQTASQQDSWVQYWDGDPSRIANRAHPMGLTVTQRSLAWNYPAGNESLIYFIYQFQNTTAQSHPQGAEFQRLNEAAFFAGNNALPDGGITLTNIHAAFAADMDVTADFQGNFSTAVLPFNLGIAYHGGFTAPEFTYFPDLFFPPFFTNAPGLIGVKFLRSPIDPDTDQQIGLTLFSATLNTNFGFPDPLGDKQLWRYLSGNLNPAQGDFPCSVTPEVTGPNTERSLCFVTQDAEDSRFYQASGPFTMAPGDEETIVVAYVAAPTVATLPNGDPSGIIANSSDANANPPGQPSFHPGFPSARGCANPNDVPGSCSEVDNANPIKALERGAGWVEYTGAPPASALESPENRIDQNDVEVVPGSLLGRAIVAQTIFDSRFLLGFAPQQPNFYLVPGNNQVTVVWEESPSESGEGDPFFTVASNEESALFNPNYRQFDVEGYRVWRGTSSGTLSLLAQYDYANTTYTDVTCETVLPDEDLSENSSAPAGTEGFVTGEECPADFSKTSDIGPDLTFNNGSAGANPGAGVVRLASGAAIFSGDPIVAIETDEAGAGQPLQNTGVPFVHVDDGVTNNFTYFYAVSAFDVNSPSSGPHTLRSARVTENTVPRAAAPNTRLAELNTELIDGEGNTLEQGFIPDLDPQDGTFSGPFPPTDGVEMAFTPLVPRLLPEFSVDIRIDSLVPDNVAKGGCAAGSGVFGDCWKLYVAVNVDGNETEQVIDGWSTFWNAFGGPATVTRRVSQEFNLDADALDVFGLPPSSGVATADLTFDQTIHLSANETQANLRSGSFGTDARLRHGGSRWFSGSNETVADPAAFTGVGELNGVTEVFKPVGLTPVEAGGPSQGGGSCMRSWEAFTGLAAMARAADYSFTWGGGTLSEVRDVTHNVPVMFKPTVQSSWGFLTEDANGNGALDWRDFHYISNVSAQIEFDALCGHVDDPGSHVELTDTPAMVPVYTGLDDPSGAVTPTGMGFGLYVNGERYIFVLDGMPTDGTTWNLRAVSGAIQTSEETFDTNDPGDYSYNRNVDSSSDGIFPPGIPGLTLRMNVERATDLAGTVDLTQVHTVPDPYLGSSLYDRAPTAKQLMFVNLPEEATIRIYTLTGVLVDVLVHDDITGGGREVWDVRNRNNQFVASGVYFFHVMTPDGDEHVGKFTIINQAGAN